MTSGTFHILPIGSIRVDREGRQRRDLAEIDVLADSIRRLGLIHPIVVTREGELVAGERRFTACNALGWTSIPVQFVDELDQATLKAIELEENIKRLDISWQDQVSALAAYHKLRGSEPDWSQAKTAEAIGLDRSTVGKLLAVNEELRAGNSMVKEAPKLSTALGITMRARERRDQQIIEGLRDKLGGPIDEAPPESILNEDFTEWVLGEATIRFNFVHCDFPYGIEADTFNQGSAPSFGGYADTRETWEKLMFALERAMRDHIAPSAHLMFWFAMRKGDERLYEPTAHRLECLGWDINPMPLIWMKTDGSGILPDPQRGPRQIYETCLLGSIGDRKIIRAKANAYGCPSDNKVHMSTKPEPMLRHFFEMLVDQNTIMLDPTCGSGTAIRAAESLNARYTLGLEVNTEFAELARTELHKFRMKKKAADEAVG